MPHKKALGFTLLELLLVVAALSILTGIVIFAINPARQLAEARNTQRRADVSIILNAIYEYMADNGGVLPVGNLTTNFEEICKTGLDSETCSGMIDLGALTENERYLITIPNDPSGLPNDVGTGYIINQSSNGSISIQAPLTEIQETFISITR